MARIIQQNATDISVAVRVFTAAGAPVNITHAEAGLAFQAKLGTFRAAAVTISPVTRADDVAAHEDGGFVAVGTAFGEHRLDLTDSCTASLGPIALSGKTTAGHVFVFEDVTVVPYDPTAANPTVVLAAQTHTGAVIPTVTTVNGLAPNTMTSSALATDAVNEIVAAVFARAFDATKMSGLTFEQVVALMASALLSKASGLATSTVTFRNPGDTANAIVATVDADGNRSAVTLTTSAVV